MEDTESRKIKQLNLRLSQADLKKLDALVAERGQGKSEFVRDCIRNGDSYLQRRLDGLERLLKVSCCISAGLLLLLIVLVWRG